MVVSVPGRIAVVPAVVPMVSVGRVTVGSGVSEVKFASEASEDAALSNMDDASDTSEFDTAGSVAVATMLVIAALNDEAMLSSTGGVVVVSVTVGVGALPESVRMLPRPLVKPEATDVMAPERLGTTADNVGSGSTPSKPVSEDVELGVAEMSLPTSVVVTGTGIITSVPLMLATSDGDVADPGTSPDGRIPVGRTPVGRRPVKVSLSTGRPG